MTRLAHDSIFTYAPVAITVALTSWLTACSGDATGDAEGGSSDSTAGGDGLDDGVDDDGSTGSTAVDETGDGTSGGLSSGDVEIRRDGHGVPHILADTDAGALYGLGYATAQDRLLQMSVSVLVAQGRVAEFFGEDYFEQDKKFRLMGHWRHAERMAPTLDAEHQELLQAYADGVNAWVLANPDAVNPQFAALGLDVPSWTPVHSLAVWYRVSDLFTNDVTSKAQGLVDFEAEVAAVGLQQAIANAGANAKPGNTQAAVVQSSDVPQEVQDAIAGYAAKMGYGEQSQVTAPHNYGHVTPKFSHAWVMSGDRTSTGESVLVSDPQVPVTSPAFMYEWAIVGDAIHARGVSPAGVPGLLIGYTPTVAWGLTAAGIDSRDLYRLEMTDSEHYTVDGVEHALTSETEMILIAGGQGREVHYRESTWGPVITDLIPGVPGEFAMKGLPFSATERDPFVAMVAMMRSKDIDDVRAAVEQWTTPSANLLVAGPGGSIFFTVIGDIPLRSIASPLGGKIAQDGSATEYDWADVIPQQFRPWVLDPAAGSLLSANHRSVGDWYPLPLGAGQGGGGDSIRSRRLRELLEALPPTMDPATVLDDVQWDCVNVARRDLVALGAHIRSVQPGRLSESTINLLDHLDAWQTAGGSMLTEQAGVYLASRISVKFRVQQTGPEINAQYGGGQVGLSLFLDDMMAQIADDSSYVPSNEVMSYVQTELAAAWSAATASMPDPEQWDAVYANTTTTPTLEYLSGLDLQGSDFGPALQSPTLACADGNTIWSQRAQSYTQHVHLGSVDDSRTVLPPGNTEVGQSELFGSQLDTWAEGSLKSAALSVSAIQALGEPVDILELP
ncbi:MAG: penicillin acylase family protein [Nannocystaceae bacterium]|nr:penicillin acylase family protein [Nannocystaceae bacterium]